MSLSNKGHFLIDDNNEFVAMGITIRYKSLLSPNSGMTADGVSHLEWVMSKKREIEITMPPMTAAELSTLYSLVQGKEYSLTFYDPIEGELDIDCYTESTAAKLYSGIISNGLYIGVAFVAKEIGGDV
jgi:hypothetical protein